MHRAVLIFEPGWRSVTKLTHRDDARRIAAKFGKVPELLSEKQVNQ
jgi:hypothetical protein